MKNILTKSKILTLGLVFCVLMTSCDDNAPTQQTGKYSGPKREEDNMELIMTDSARLSVRLQAPKLLVMQNEDQHFTKGIFIEFYNKNGIKTTTLRADKGVQYRATNVHIALGNVIVTNLEKNQTLKTERLNWNPDTKKLYTDKFVTIITPEERIEGTGLEAKQDFSSYTMRKISGVFSVNQ